MNTDERAFYRDLLADIKTRLRQAQHRAILAANAEMIRLYWDIGRLIAERQQAEGWGAGVIPRLARDLKNELPELKGFSERNIGRMIAFYREYAILPRPVAKISSESIRHTEHTDNIDHMNLPRPVAKLPAGSAPPSQWEWVWAISWAHHIILIEKVKDLPVRRWYAEKAVQEGWSRDTLTVQIKNRAYERQGFAVTNFSATLPQAHAAIAQGLLKDPYLFDFLTLDEPFHERELETGLLGHIQKFLIELGRGFAFVGRQYRLEVNGHEFYLDLLFYHLHLRCFVVVDFKKGGFKPEHAGKMNFYCSVVDDHLRHPGDAATVGLILCQTKDRVVAEYALRDIHKPIGVADYELTRALPAELATSLPSIEDIEAEFSADLRNGVGQ